MPTTPNPTLTEPCSAILFSAHQRRNSAFEPVSSRPRPRDIRRSAEYTHYVNFDHLLRFSVTYSAAWMGTCRRPLASTEDNKQHTMSTWSPQRVSRLHFREKTNTPDDCTSLPTPHPPIAHLAPPPNESSKSKKMKENKRIQSVPPRKRECSTLLAARQVTSLFNHGRLSLQPGLNLLIHIKIAVNSHKTQAGLQQWGDTKPSASASPDAVIRHAPSPLCLPSPRCMMHMLIRE